MKQVQCDAAGSALRSALVIVLALLLWAGPFVGTADAQVAVPSISITGLASGPDGADSALVLRLHDYLAVKLQVTPSAPVDPTQFVLFLDGRPIVGLDNVTYRSDIGALVFQLRRNTENSAAWAALLSAPGWDQRRVSVALGRKAVGGAAPTISVTGDPASTTFELVVFDWWRLGVSLLVVVATAYLVISRAGTTTLLRDSMLPQLAPTLQPFSLGRSQMAFWFTLTIGAFVFLFLFLGDYNTVNSQSLTLMGISGATAVFAVAVDASRTSTIGAANDKLKALGLTTYADVVELRAEQSRLNSLDVATLQPTQVQTNKAKLADIENLLRIYRDVVRPFRSEGWYRDITTDLNGPALHRLQILVWTVILGGVFVWEVIQTLSMPQFSDTLLALMGVTSVGYVGFKSQESQG